MNWRDKLKITAPLLRNRYVLTTLVFLVWVGFFDQNNFADRISLANRNRALENQKERYKLEIIKNRENLEELRSNSEKLEKFAREEYMMKRADEDLFIVVD